MTKRTGRRIASLAALAVVLSSCIPGYVVPLAGSGASGNSGDGGVASAATMVQPGGLLTFPDGSYDVVDQSACVIRRVAADKTISTIAGTGVCGFSGDGGPATAAQINPGIEHWGAAMGQLARDTDGNVYLTDSGNARVRRIAPHGTITTVAGDGTGSDIFSLSNCSGTSAFAGSISVAPDGAVYVACPGGIGTIQPDGTLQQVVGNVGATIMSMTTDPSGSLIYATSDAKVHRRLSDGTTTTIAIPSGLITQLVSAPDGTLYAGLGPIDTVKIIWTGSNYTYQWVHHERDIVMRLDPGAPTWIAGTSVPDLGTGSQSGAGMQLALRPFGLAIDAGGRLLVSSGHVVYRIDEPDNAAPWMGVSCNPGIFMPGANFDGLSLHGIDLPGCYLSGASFVNTDLSGANLAGANFSSTDLTGASFSFADLSGAYFNGATGNPVGGSTAIYAGTTCPDATVVTSPATCVGHGFAN